ncbi:CHAT domain-containing protein [Mycena epipterygia]|nr:CHAT domain-containing protein [Mycena epipterygia]
MAALLRFSYTGDLKDVELAFACHAGSSTADVSRLQAHMENIVFVGEDDPEELIIHALAKLAEFHSIVDSAGLDATICLHRQSLSAFPSEHPHRWKAMFGLSNGLLIRFGLSAVMEDLQEAVLLLHEVQPLQPNRTVYLCAALLMKNQEMNICKGREATKIFLQCTASNLEALEAGKLGASLIAAFDNSWDPQNLDIGISKLREAELRLSWGHPERSGVIQNLANAIHMRVKEEGDFGNIDEAVKLHQEALSLRPSPHPARGLSLADLADVVLTRFETGGDPGDIDEVILLRSEALVLHPFPHPDREELLESLGHTLEARFRQRGDIKDVNRCVELYKEALRDPSKNRARRKFLKNLARALGTQFNQSGRIEDLNEAVKMYREVLEPQHMPYQEVGLALNHLARALITRFERLGNHDDLDEAIELHREALHAFQPGHMSNTGPASDSISSFWLKQIASTQGAVPLTPKSLAVAAEFRTRWKELESKRPGRGLCMNNLANAVQIRFTERGKPHDIEEAIKLYTEILALYPSPHPFYSNSLTNLSGALVNRFDQEGNPDDIKKAVELGREAVALRTSNHPYSGSSLANLATAVHMQFQMRGDPDVGQEAVGLHREALALHASPHSLHSESLNGLACALETRFRKQENLDDIYEAVELHKKALELRVSPHPDRGKSLVNLGVCQILMYEHTRLDSALNDGLGFFEAASSYASLSPLECFRAARDWAKCATEFDHSTALTAYERMTSLLPQLAALHLDVRSRQAILAIAQLGSTASDAVSCAIAHHDYAVGVELAEASRSVFWGQALNLRTPLDDLAIIDPQLASSLSDIAQQLDQASLRDTSRDLENDSHVQVLSVESEGVRCRHLKEDWERTVRSIRLLPDFEDFMCPKKMAKLQQAAEKGPVVILSAANSRCNVLIIMSSGPVQFMPVQGTSKERVMFMANFFQGLSLEMPVSGFPSEDFDRALARLKGWQEITGDASPNQIFATLLQVLWEEISKPVLEFLNYKKSTSPPRLWWCPIGPLAFLPLHAAGLYGTYGEDCVSDYVVSSYTPTLSALLNPPIGSTTAFKMTAVIEPNAPNASYLPGAEAELQKIERRVPAQVLTSLGRTSSATRETTLQYLRESSIVHFACHGIQDLQNPLDSGLLLSNGRLNVSDFMQQQKDPDSTWVTKPMSLAFLSACETAKGDLRVPDEAMHLAGTLLFAGFRGVVATMWTIRDTDGPKVADAFYERLFKDSDFSINPPILPDLIKAAEALHFAIQKLREEPGIPFMRWVPFVHYGL